MRLCPGEGGLSILTSASGRHVASNHAPSTIPLAFIPLTGDYGPDSRMTRDRRLGLVS